VKIGGETARCQQARKGAGTKQSGGGYLWRRQDPGRDRAGFIHASRSPLLNAFSLDSCLFSRLPLDLLPLLQNRLSCPRKSPSLNAPRHHRTTATLLPGLTRRSPAYRQPVPQTPLHTRSTDGKMAQSAERMLMNEFKALSKETWTNIEVRRTHVPDGDRTARDMADRLTDDQRQRV
jgi:hypothetical protein